MRAISLPCVNICLHHRMLRMMVADGRPPCPWCFRHRHRRRNGFGAVGDCSCWDSASPVARAVAVVAACWGPWSGTSWPPAQCDPQNRPQTSTTAPVAHARAGDPMSEPFSFLWGARYKSARTHARAMSRSQTTAPRETSMCVCVRAWECECAEVRVCGCTGRAMRHAHCTDFGPRSEENKIRRGNGIMLFFGWIFTRHVDGLSGVIWHTAKSAASSTSHGGITPDLLSARTVRLWLAAVNRHAPRDRSLPRSWPLPLSRRRPPLTIARIIYSSYW